jgi:MinD-like ATPase involved in chromosome partitioning or flagellar assembly
VAEISRKSEEEKKPSSMGSQVPRDIEKLFSSLNLGNAGYQKFGNAGVSRLAGEPPPGPTPVDPTPAEIATATPATAAPATAASVAPSPRDPVEQELFSVAVYSPMGGAGKSLLAASVGALLCRLGRRVLLVDTSPWHTLATHFGATDPRAGLRTFRVPDGENASIRVLHANAGTPPDLVPIRNIDCVIFDLGDISEQEATTWLKQCDRVLVPLAPTAQAPSMAKLTRQKLEAAGLAAKQIRFVLNLVDQGPASHRVGKLLKELLQDQLFPQAIERQPVVDEALSEGIALPYFAPESEATKACQQIVNWLQVPAHASSKTARRWLEE